MIKIRLSVLAAACLLSTSVMAQTPAPNESKLEQLLKKYATPSAAAPAAPLPYGTGLTLAEAHTCAEAVRVEAARNSWLMVVSVVDSGGHEVLTERMDNTQFGSVAPAVEKARAAAAWRRPTKVFEEMIAAGGTSLRVLDIPGVIAIDGGLPIVRKGHIIGGVGTSGGTSAQDGVAAAACLKALEK